MPLGRQLALLIVPGGLAALSFALMRVAGEPARAPEFLGGMTVELRYLAGVVAWLALAWFSSRLFDILLERAMVAARTPMRYPRLLGDLVRAALFGLAVVAIASFVFEGTASGFIATSGVLIAVIGFALRGVIGDVFSGIVLGFEHPYRIGDWIEVSGSLGRVAEIDWRATRIVTRDGISVTVPNGVVAAGRLVNYSYPQSASRTSLRLALDVDVPVARAKRILLSGALDAARGFPGLRPDVLVQETTDAGVVYVVRFWMSDWGEENACRDAVMTAILAALDRAGLAPARPKLDVARRRGRMAAGGLSVEELLERVELFGAFTGAERRQLAECMAERFFAAGTTIVDEGEPGDSLFVVAEGAVDVSGSSPDGARLALDRMVAGDVFGEMSLLTGAPRSASITAATDVAAYEVRREHLEPLLRDRPGAAAALAGIMMERQRRNAEMRDARAASEADTAGDASGLLRRLRAFFGLGGGSAV